MKLVCMAILIGLWHRLILWVCLSLFLLRGLGKARPQTGFHFTVQRRPLSGSVLRTSGASFPKRPHLESGNEACPSGKKSTGGSVSTSSMESRRKWEAWGLALLMGQSPQPLHPPHHLHLQLFRLVCFQNFWSMEKHYI